MCQIGEPVRMLTLTRKRGRIAYRAFDTDWRGAVEALFSSSSFERAGNRADRKPTLTNDGHGFWCFYSWRRLLVEYPGRQVYAKVRVWGKVAQHTYGYRAERLDILAIVGGMHKRDVAAHYGLPMRPPPARRSRHG